MSVSLVSPATRNIRSQSGNGDQRQVVPQTSQTVPANEMNVTVTPIKSQNSKTLPQPEPEVSQT